MPALADILRFLDSELRIAEIPDYSGAVNGLQLQNNGTVTKVACAVDASLPVVRKAIAAGADLLIVHHGMFWQGAQPLTGAFYQKIHEAMQANLAIYSAHLPLDVHPQWGNNALLAEAIGMTVTGTFLPYKGLPVGVTGEMERGLQSAPSTPAPLHRDELRQRLEAAVGGPVLLCPAGPEFIHTIGLCTGGAGSEVAAAAGLDAFISGEGPHWSYPLAEEMGLNLFLAGHYATETFGVRQLGEILVSHFSINAEFIEHPTGL
jgi:dinuclear metal center YbgI/SA1388 family protein